MENVISAAFFILVLVFAVHAQPSTRAVNGNWGQWGAYVSCSVTCGQGTLSHKRACNNPLPGNGGLACLLSNSDRVRSSSEIKSEICNLEKCTDEQDGTGSGTVEQSNSGTVEQSNSGTVEQSNSGKIKIDNCPDADKQIISLYQKIQLLKNRLGYNVAVDGNWGQWSHTSSCSVTKCGAKGLQTRQRSCNSPSASGGGLQCLITPGLRSDVETVVETCQLGACTDGQDGTGSGTEEQSKSGTESGTEEQSKSERINIDNCQNAEKHKKRLYQKIQQLKNRLGCNV